MLPIIGVTILLEVDEMCYAQMKSYMRIPEYKYYLLFILVEVVCNSKYSYR